MRAPITTTVVPCRLCGTCALLHESLMGTLVCALLRQECLTGCVTRAASTPCAFCRVRTLRTYLKSPSMHAPSQPLPSPGPASPRPAPRASAQDVGGDDSTRSNKRCFECSVCVVNGPTSLSKRPESTPPRPSLLLSIAVYRRS